MEKDGNNLMEKIISLCKRRGFVFPGSEIYGGLANSWDYGPYGSQLKKNIKDHWWKFFVESREDMVGIDAALIMNPRVWEASGHVSNFSDPMVDCKRCNFRFRLDKLIEDNHNLPVGQIFREYIENWSNDLQPRFESWQKEARSKTLDIEIETARIMAEVKARQKALLDAGLITVNDLDRKGPKINASVKYEYDSIGSELREFLKVARGGVPALLEHLILLKRVSCPKCSSTDFTHPKNFNLMLETSLGPVEDENSKAYLRPETAQAMFVDFVSMQQTSRKKLPFGIAQIGKAFRNEITPGNFIFRTREFEQMEIEYFFDPKKSDWIKLFDGLKTDMETWMEMVGIKKEKTHAVDIPDGERAHYSQRTIDFEFDYPFGQKELFGLAYRGDYDLEQHEKNSQQELRYLDPETNEKVRPHVIEPSLGVDRAMLAILLSAYEEEEVKEGDIRTVLRLKSSIAPVQVAVFPLLKNKPELVEKAREIYQTLKKDFRVEWDDNGNVGKRYRRQDEIGTPYCVTVDFDTIGQGEDKSLEGTVTVRDRDTMEQKRVKIEELKTFLNQ